MIPYNPFLLTLVALVPGVVVWWTGRRIAPRTSDPALPELLWAHQHRTRSVFLTTFFVLIFLGGRGAFWAVPLMGITTTIGGTPLRRALGIETANLARQLWRNAKSVVGGLGFWIGLALIPEIVLSIDPHYRALGLLVIPILLAWEHWYRPIWLRAHDAEPITDAQLISRFVAIDTRAGIASPRVYRIGARDARFVNAFAFPEIRDPAIGLGNALIELLDPDEVGAIYAHELSHIEHASPRKLRHRQFLTRSLIVAGAVLPLGIALIAPNVATWIPWVWPLIAIGAISLRGKKSKQLETECDLRAAALCGDAEVMIRALIKTHVHAFIPRRWDVDFERQASHPSLTRRIQALRGESVQAAEAPEAPVMFRTAREGGIVAFDRARAYWFDGVPANTPLELDALRTHAASSRSVVWGELVELRVVIGGDKRALQAKHSNGDSWSVPLESSEVESVQKALDVVDIRLRRELGKASIVDVRLVTTTIVVAMLWAAEVSVLFIPALIALFKPSTVMLAALGSMAIASGLFGSIREWSAGGIDWRIGLLSLTGVAALVAAWHRARREKKVDGARLTAITCGAMAVLLIIPAALTAIELPVSAVAQRGTVTGVALMLVGLATALLFVSTRVSKIGAVVVTGLAAILTAPSISALGLFSGAGRFTRARVSATEVARVALDHTAMELSVSPNGDRFLVREIPEGGDGDEDEEGSRRLKPRYIVGSFNGAKRRVEALQAALFDESHLLVLRRAAGGLELRLEGDDSAAVWTVRLPPARFPVLTVSPRDRRWTILSEERELDSVLVISGDRDGSEPVVRRMATGRRARHERGNYDMGQTLILGDRIVAPAFEYKRRGPTMLAMFTMTPRVDLWETTTSGEQKVGTLDGMPQCGMTDDATAMCVVHQPGDRSQLWTVDRTGPARYEGIVPLGDIGRMSIGPGARVSGIRMRDATVLAVDVAARKVWSIKLPSDSAFATEVRAVPGRIAVLRLENGKSVLLAYKVAGL